MNASRNNIYIVIGFFSYVLACLLQLTGFEQTWYPNLFTAIAFLASFWHFNTHELASTDGTMHLFFSSAARKVVYILPFFAFTLVKLTFDFDPNSLLLKILSLIQIYAVLIFFLYCLACYKKLIFERKDHKIIQIWSSYAIFLMIAACLHIKIPSQLYFLKSAIFITGCMFMPFLLLRLSWIALLKRKEKILAIGFLVSLTLITLAWIQTIITVQVPNFILSSPDGSFVGFLINNTFISLIIILVLSYSFLGLLALLFNFPMWSFMEEQYAELLSYQEISDAIRNKESTEQIFHKLFQVCLKNTLSHSGWLVLNRSGEGQEYYMSKISSSYIGNINVKINFKELIKIEPKRGYYYFPNLLKRGVFDTKDEQFKSLLILPIFTQKKQLRGAICLVKSFVDGFDDYFINLTKGYINQAKLAFENAQLLSEAVEAARYKEELDIARNVQKELLPKNFPNLEHCEIAAFSESAKEIGGDYYDYNRIDDFQLAVIIGDVSGKGASAAFHMAQMKGIFQALMQLCLPADNFLFMANHAITYCLQKNQFITVAYTFFDFSQNIITYSRAGHCPLLYYSAADKKVSYLQGEGVGLGIIRNNRYANFVKAHNIPLQVNDVFVLYTDGLVEGRKNNTIEQYGYERLKWCFEQNYHRSAKEIKQAICKDFQDFTQTENYMDDTSLVVIKIINLDEPI